MLVCKDSNYFACVHRRRYGLKFTSKKAICILSIITRVRERPRLRPGLNGNVNFITMNTLRDMKARSYGKLMEAFCCPNGFLRFLSLFTGLLMLSTQLVLNYHIFKGKQTDEASQNVAFTTYFQRSMAEWAVLHKRFWNCSPLKNSKQENVVFLLLYQMHGW